MIAKEFIKQRVEEILMALENGVFSTEDAEFVVHLFRLLADAVERTLSPNYTLERTPDDDIEEIPLHPDKSD